jgi:hypothetical protein
MSVSELLTEPASGKNIPESINQIAIMNLAECH